MANIYGKKLELTRSMTVAPYAMAVKVKLQSHLPFLSHRELAVPVLSTCTGAKMVKGDKNPNSLFTRANQPTSRRCVLISSMYFCRDSAICAGNRDSGTTSKLRKRVIR